MLAPFTICSRRDMNLGISPFAPGAANARLRSCMANATHKNTMVCILPVRYLLHSVGKTEAFDSKVIGPGN